MANYDYQEDCLEAMKVANKGKIIIPTGGGKSRIEFEYAKSKLVANDNIHQIVVIVAPRIILCQQLIRNFYRYVSAKYGDISEVFTFVSSGRVPAIEIDGKIIPSHRIGRNTTDKKEILYDLLLAIQHKRDSVVFSTYDSFGCLMAAIKLLRATIGGEVHLIADEAHCFVRGADSHKNRSAFRALKENLDLFDTRFFFTATPKIIDDGGEETACMNNEEVYGSTAFNIKPKELIKRGAICEPRLHRVTVPTYINDENFKDHAPDVLKRCFLKHKQYINEGKDDRIGAKVLVAVSGSKQLKSLIETRALKDFQDEGINVAWTMSREDVGTYINGKDYKSNDFLEKLYEVCADDQADLIVLHYDQLTEGIDIPSMTGLLILRDMNRVKKVQNIGRVLRVHPKDREKEFNEKAWLKPYSYVIVPDRVGISRFDGLMKQLVNEYDANIQIQTVDVAAGLDDRGIELQEVQHDLSEFKSVSGNVLHEIKIFNSWREKIEEQEESDKPINPL